MNNISGYKLIIFDLDDTIYSEINYLKLAYKYIAKEITKLNSSLFLNEISSFLVTEFLNHGRTHIFQKLVKNFNINNFSCEMFVDCLRTVPILSDSIPVFPEIDKIVANLVLNNRIIVILTNGNPKQQQNKIKAINLSHKEKIHIYYASSRGKNNQKPSSYFINLIKEKFSIENSILFIGDSKIDRMTAKNSNIDFMNIIEIRSN